MHNQSDLFNEVIKTAYGARRYLGTDPAVAQLLKSTRWHDEQLRNAGILVPNAPNIYFDVIDLTPLNAVAFWRDGVDAVGLFRGCAEVMRDITYNLLCHSSTFTTVGSPLVEPNPPQRTSIYPDTAYMDVAVTSPIDPNRRLLADSLAEFMARFLILHELGHAYRGHTRYDKASQSSSFINEVAHSGALSSDEILTRQALEMDADSFAVAQLLSDLYRSSKSIEDGTRAKNLSSIADFMADKLQVLQLLGYATYLVCRMFREFEKEQFTLDRLDKTIHPPARVRQKWLVQTVLAWCKSDHFEINIDTGFECMGRGMSAAEADIAAILGKDVDLTEEKLALDPKVDEHLMRVLDRFKALEPQLKRASYMASFQP